MNNDVRLMYDGLFRGFKIKLQSYSKNVYLFYVYRLDGTTPCIFGPKEMGNGQVFLKNLYEYYPDRVR